MGGTSSTSQTQSSSTQPWTQAQPTVNGILGALNPLIGNSGLTSPQQTAIQQLSANAAEGNPYAPQIGANATSLLNGGGAMNQAGQVNQNYQNYFNQTNPLASNTNYDPTQSPGMQAVLQQIRGDVGTSVNGMFEGSGRGGSGMNQQTLARGISQGEAQPLLSQYNTNVANQQGAAQNLFGAGTTTTNALTGMQQQQTANRQAGTQAANDALAARNYGPTSMLAAQQLGQQIPAQNLGLLAQIGIPIAGLGSQSTGQSNGTSTMSGADQFGKIAGGIGSLGSMFATPASAGAAGTSGIGGLLAMLSDRRVKEDIERVGIMFDGTPVYRYRYAGHQAFMIGLMADEVEKTTPEAVSVVDGFKAVDYRLATEKAVHALAWGC